MTSENVCKYAKFGYCRQKNECKDYHPSEVCRDKICNVSRHPQPCRYFEAGSCRFGDYCEYSHKKQKNEKELFERLKKLESEKKNEKVLLKRIEKLENEKKNEKELLEKIEKLENENQDLHTRMSHLEKEHVSFLKIKSDRMKKLQMMMMKKWIHWLVMIMTNIPH